MIDATPIAYLRDAHQGEGDECFVPAAKDDPGAFPVYDASALEALSIRAGEMEEALRPFAEAAKNVPNDQPDSKVVAYVPAGTHAKQFDKLREFLKAEHFRRARQALSNKD